MDILNQLRTRHGLPTTGNADHQSTTGHDVAQRFNYMTCGNLVELGTEIVHGLVKNGDGLANQIGDNRLYKRDIATMISAKLARRIQRVVDNNGSNQA